jgi:RNA polymerase sigma-70 factor (ECF subfamily)
MSVAVETGVRSTGNANMTETDDGALVARIAEARDREAFEALFRRHVKAAHSLARMLSNDRSDAEEAVQEGMLDCWRKASTYRPTEGSPRAWLMRIVANRALGLARKRRSYSRRLERHREGSRGGDAGGGRADEGASEDEKAALRGLVERLPPANRQVLALYFGAALSQDEIAAQLDLAQSTVSHRIQEALRTLRSGMRRAGFAAAVALAEPELAERLLAAYAPPRGLWERVAARVGKGPGSVKAPAVSARAGAPARAWVAGLALVALASGAVLVWNGAGTRNAVRAEPDGVGGALPDPRPTDRRARANRTWTFDAPGAMKDLVIHRGNWKHLPAGGRNGSGCIQIEGGDWFGVLLPVEARDLPVRVSVWSPVPMTGRSVKMTVTWDDAATTLAGFSNFAKNWGSGWARHDFYICDRYMEGRVDGRRSMFSIMTPSGRIMLATRWAQRIDDLTIEPIKSNDLPDATAFLEAYRRLRPGARRGDELPVPELRQYAAPGKQIELWFVLLRTEGAPETGGH